MNQLIQGVGTLAPGATSNHGRAEEAQAAAARAARAAGTLTASFGAAAGTPASTPTTGGVRTGQSRGGSIQGAFSGLTYSWQDDFQGIIGLVLSTLTGEGFWSQVFNFANPAMNGLLAGIEHAIATGLNGNLSNYISALNNPGTYFGPNGPVAVNWVGAAAEAMASSFGSAGAAANWAGSGGGLGIPSFAGGGLMPHTGLAMLHKGERVLTPEQQGGVHVHFHAPVYGADDFDRRVAQAVKTNSRRGAGYGLSMAGA